MKKQESLKCNSLNLFQDLKNLYNELDDSFILKFNRSLPFNDTLLDRWERAKKLGFGENTSIYNSALVFGNVKVGKNCWIGPFTIIDGSGNLEIGDFCTISAGVQIYTHDNLKQTLSSKKLPIEKTSVNIGNNVYIGPNVIVSRGVTIGNYCVIGANSFVNKDVPNNCIAFGQPAKLKGKVIVNNGDVILDYYKNIL